MAGSEAANLVLSLVLALVATALVSQLFRKRADTSVRLPPAIPPPSDRARPFLHFEAMAKKPETADICSFTFGGKTTIILNSLEAVAELLEKRSNTYSGRPKMELNSIARGDLVGTMLSPASTYWKRWRSLMHTALTKHASDYTSWQSQETLVLLKQLLDDPKAWREHCRLHNYNLMILLGYGRRSAQPDKDSSFLLHQESQMKTMKRMGGTSRVERYPSLRFLPDIFARYFQPDLVEAREIFTAETPRYTALLDEAKKRSEAGWPASSITSVVYEQGGPAAFKLNTTQVAYAAAMSHLAGLDTLATSLQAFLLSCLAESDSFLAKARQELDEVVGNERLPTLVDKLPFCDAVVKEAMRWARPIPIALPHATTKVDVYGGYTIPAGSTVMANVWAISHDSRVYKNPKDFRAERWLDDSLPFSLPPGFFGFTSNRRVCPGSHFALNQLNIVARRLLWAFDFSSGDPAFRADDYSKWKSLGVLTWAEDMPLIIKPRSVRHAEVLRAEYEAAKPELDALIAKS